MAKSASRTATMIQILMRIRAALPPRCPHLITALAPALAAFDAQHIELAFDVAEDEEGARHGSKAHGCLQIREAWRRFWTCRHTDGEAARKIVPPRLRIPYWKGLVPNPKRSASP